MQLPVIPSFTANETSLLHLQQLSAAAQFSTVASSFPMWRYYKTSPQAITAGTWNTLVFGTVGIDTDGISNNQNATIQTQGYYRVEACIPFQGVATGGPNNVQGSFLWTAGPNNPNFSSGTTNRFGGTAQSAAQGTGTDYVYNITDQCPVVCYPGDTIVVQAWPTTATSIDNAANTSGTAGWFPAQFSGRWIRTGS